MIIELQYTLHNKECLPEELRAIFILSIKQSPDSKEN